MKDINTKLRGEKRSFRILISRIYNNLYPTSNSIELLISFFGGAFLKITSIPSQREHALRGFFFKTSLISFIIQEHLKVSH